MMTAFTRPASLRFKDLVEGIAEYSDIVHKTAAASAQLELRDIHKNQETIQTTVKGLKDEFKTLVARNMNLEALYEGQEHIVAVLESMEKRIICEYSNSISASDPNLCQVDSRTMRTSATLAS